MHVQSCRSVALRGLLLSSSALVATSLLAPLAMAQSVIINDARTTTQNLDSLLPPGDPRTAQVTGSGSVIVNTPNSVGVSATAAGWTLTNNGRISGDGFGVQFTAGGTVTNTALINVDVPAPIFSGTAVQIDGGFGAVTNSGTIAGGIGSGVDLKQTGMVLNQANGTISSNIGDGIHIGGFTTISVAGKDGTVTNAGRIDAGSNGVWFDQGGTLTNQSGATIRGDNAAVVFNNGAGTVTNSGTLAGGAFGDAVALGKGGIVINNQGAVISSQTDFTNALSIAKIAGTVDNAGRIEATVSGGFATGVAINGGTLINRATGQIDAYYNGVWVNGSTTVSPAGTIDNSGSIKSVFADAIEIDPDAGVVINRGTIATDSNSSGIWMLRGGTVTNSGTIASNGGGLAIKFSGSTFSNTLILDTGSVLIGNVNAGGGTDDLKLHGSGIEVASKFLNFENLEMNGTDWTLNGAGTFSNAGQITAGTLRINGNLTTPTLSVLSGGTLAGGGTVSGNVMASSGRVAPSSPITTLQIGGTLTMGSSSHFHVDLDPASASQVRATSDASLQGGHIDVAFAPGAYTTGTVYTVLHSDTTVAGSFLENSVVVGSYHFDVSYDPNNVYLTLLRLAFDDPTVCASRNQCAVGGALERLGPVIPGDLGNVVNMLGMLDIPSQRLALASMAGDMHPTLALLALDGHALFGQSVTRRLADRRNASQQTASSGDGSYNIAMAGNHDGLVAANVPSAPDALWGAWMRGYGVSGTLDGDLNASGAVYFAGGLAAGLDRQFAPGFTAGVSFGYANTRADFQGSDTSGRIDSFDIGLYGSYQWAGFHLDAVASYAFLDNRTDRQIVVGDIVRQASASYHGQRYGLALEAGYDIQLGGFTLQPILSGQYVHLRQNAFHEDGAGGLDLDGKRSSTDSLRGSAGLKVGTQLDAGGVVLAPELRGRYEHEFLDTRAQTDVNFVGQSSAGEFTVVGARVPRDSLIVGGGLAAMLSPWTTAFVDYDFKFNKEQKIHNLTAGIRFEF